MRTLITLFLLMCSSLYMHTCSAQPPHHATKSDLPAGINKNDSQTQTTTFNSPEKRVQLIELYTSQGCSSCPPADRWLNQLTSKAILWEEYIPLAFHVDYWDYIGWKDPFAAPAYSKRQRQYQSQGHTNSVYTPQFIVGGNEWRSWFSSRILPKTPEYPGVLSARITQSNFTANYQPTKKLDNPVSLHVAVLGFNQNSKIRRGENQGTVFKGDFVVLSKKSFHQPAATHRWAGKLPLPDRSIGSEPIAAVFWIEAEGSHLPIQATGGYIHQ